MQQSILDCALRYAQLGYRVFPCQPGSKVPLIKNWRQEATTNREKIQEWFPRWPNANIAIPTDDLIVFDIDDRNCSWFQDHEIADALQKAGAISVTPRGGWHFLFRKPKDKQWRCSTSKLAKGVDIRTNGGYIVAPNSKIGDKVYQWLDGYELDVPLQELPEPPAKLIELLDSQSGSKTKTQSAKLTDADTIPEGQRNETLFKHGCLLRSWGHTQEEITATLLAMNQQRCQPPLPESEVKTLAASAAKYTPEQAKVEALKNNGAQVKTATTEGELVMTHLHTVEHQEIPWLWPGKISKGALTVLVGRPGEGKSVLTLEIAARVSTGRSWPDGAPGGPPGSVLLMSLEDDKSYTIRPRLEALGADLTKIVLLEGVRQRDGQQEWIRPITVWETRRLAEALQRMPDCQLLIIDPIGDFLGPVDAHKENEVRQALSGVGKIAEEYRIAVLLVMHYRKAGGLTADELALGSRAFTAVARSVWHLGRDPGDRERRLLLPGKCNLALQSPGLAFRIQGNPARIEWEPDPIEKTADDVLANHLPVGGTGRAARGEALEDAIEFLRQELSAGQRPAEELKEKWRAAHFGSVATLKRAKKELGVEAHRPQIPGPWYWRLPGQGDQGDQGDQFS